MSLTNEQAVSPGLTGPRPGDGAYLRTPQPGDGDYLTQQQQQQQQHRPGPSHRGGGGGSSGRGGQPRRGQPVQRQPSRDLANASHHPNPAMEMQSSFLRPAVELISVVAPRSDAAQRARDAHEHGPPRSAIHTSGQRNLSRNKQGRNRNPNVRAHGAALNPSAPAFTLPTTPMAHLTLRDTPDPNRDPTQAASAVPGVIEGSSRASSVEGRSRSDGEAKGRQGGRRGRQRAGGKSRPEAGNGHETQSNGVPLHNGEPHPGKTGSEPETPVQKSSRRAAFEKQTKLTSPEQLISPSSTSAKAASSPNAPSGPNGARDPARSGATASKPARGGGVRRAGGAREEKDDLVSRLTRGLGRKPFLECPICFNAITPAQAIYSCLPPMAPPSSSATHGGAADPADLPANYYQACYTPFHLTCIRDWADRSLAEEEDKIRTLLLDDPATGERKRPEWRCPGCQKRREDRVGLYKCFCGRIAQPPTNGSSPHSCSEPCSRPRATCAHPCPLPCHPGPCPPCQVALIVPCPSHHSSLTVKCAVSTALGQTTALGAAGMGVRAVCDEVCARPRGCGNREHVCELLCHFGLCAPCAQTESVQCYCGAESREEVCGWNREQERQCAKLPESGIEEHWVGRFGCGRVCAEAYDCGVHYCEEKCHPHPLSPLTCPLSPSIILTCPCGQSALPLPQQAPRTQCTDPIPTCGLPCPRSRPCGHPCPLKCHEGECAPCLEEVVRPCRCGESLMVVRCEVVNDLQSREAREGGEVGREEGKEAERELRCERVCKALRNCGRHECSRVCCPLSYKAKSSRSRRKDDPLHPHPTRHSREDDLHACPLTCGKLLSCGLHTCQRRDHRGACGRCLEASYEELVCHCGETIVYPPVACGTTISCLYPCARPPPACGHPRSAHNCHESPVCPPCPYLTTRPCACGKDPAVKNVRCSQTNVSCGQVCGTLLPCGYHRCDKSCHRPASIDDAGVGGTITSMGGCGDCHQVCGKPKRTCRHPCTAACHAPAKCPETDPCQAIIDQKCACGNLSVRTTCGATATADSAPVASRESTQLKCNSECAVKQRNARLAEALGIKMEGRGEAEWSGELKGFGAANHAFVKTVENAFGEFIKGAKQSVILPHMPPSKRSFVISLAAAYKLSTELVDQEPNRSVLIRRRVDTRVPQPLLSAAIQPVSKPALGGLGNLRAPTASVVSSTPAGSAAWGKPASSSSGSAAINGSAAGAKSSWSAALTGSSTPAERSGVVTPIGSGARTPVDKVSRPVTPVAPVLQQLASGTLGGGMGCSGGVVGDKRAVVGQVGQVEEDDDWDVDA